MVSTLLWVFLTDFGGTVLVGLTLIGLYRFVSLLLRQRARRAKEGQALTEMALFLPLICLLLYGSLDLARLIKTQTELNNAAHVGVMVAQNVQDPQGTPVTYHDVVHAVQIAYPNATVTVVPGGNPTDPVPTAGTVTVKVSTGYKPVTPFVRTILNISTLTGISAGQQLP